MDAIVRRLASDGFSELPGLNIRATVPIPEQLVNEILAAALAGDKNIEAFRVSIDRENRVSVNVKIPGWPWPIQVKLKLFRVVDFSGSPKIRAFLENNVLLGRLGALFNALPDGVMFYENQISVDIGRFLQTSEQKQMLEFIKSMEIHTEEHRVILDIEAAR